MWDCLRAGAVPIYKGAPNVAEYLPGGKASAIFVDDFASYRELGEFVRKVGGDEKLWQGCVLFNAALPCAAALGMP